MIYEIAILPIQQARIDSFRHAFAEVAPLLSRAKGYLSHLLAQGIETPHHFNLIVQWQSLEDHTPGFETSEDHQVFMAHLTPYFSEEPTVYHIHGGALETHAPAGPGDARPMDIRLNS
ncbi:MULTISPECIES: antibiotic biosynthesis monooxygenase family protein [unclassified Pseudomonas]|jgi:heme-degrading monooxygenase HmoA|uniref:antibiotic biosynthesis monooxygenase family protein n=1 Tax=unclassified Pseudomonas TaxID=196821 RepID=UPI0019403C3E|nr:MULTISPECIES: antibiotic biosynthesis monooxygenase [unclassified Pseudomonas]MCE0916512.1 antibiotic biosynthesis monooxygenase [Pseudomonas sp. NMI760_13]MCF1487212.1 antibiotic biosynthesis monooxygenase [Pseudomonas sp. AA27]MCP8633843.1 antibiotic biosynthesis monooxygenase [Pseudomonas sp. DVZ6]MDD7784703.1 antibiotic biosynthesis monooxygenase [Pseudomonas sp. DVZ24]BCJ09034.1 monooxygenase [Pseudomonas sp. RtIB026]